MITKRLAVCTLCIALLHGTGTDAGQDLGDLGTFHKWHKVEIGVEDLHGGATVSDGLPGWYYDGIELLIMPMLTIDSLVVALAAVTLIGAIFAGQ